MELLQFVVENWWKCGILIWVTAYLIRELSKSTDGIFSYLREILDASMRELRSNVASRRAGAINVAMLFLSVGLIILVTLPNLMSQIGFGEEKNDNLLIVGIVAFVVVCFISSHYCLSVEKQLPAFKDDDLLKKQKDKSKQTKHKKPAS